MTEGYNMYRLLFKKRGRKPVIVRDDNVGLALLLKFNDGLLTDFVVEGLNLRGEELYKIERLNEKKQNAQAEETAAVMKEWLAYRRTLIERPLHEKVEDFRIEDFIWATYSDSPMPEALRLKVMECKRAFYEKHANRMYCNPSEWIHLLKDIERKKASVIGHMATVSVVEGLIRADIAEANHP